MTTDSALLDRDSLLRRARMLEWFTILYNSLEGLISIAAGFLAGSIALVGFGIDSVIEVISGIALLWRTGARVDRERGERAEAIALKIVGVSFVLLALYVAFDSIKSLWLRETPEESVVGIVIAALSVVIMPLLARGKRQVAAKIKSRALAADAKQTDLCMYLSAILLVGLGLNALFGWWWADPIAALVMVPIIGKEGIEALRGEECECHS
jgi:divalent metal cation (Fe/Co/Zn/Cd) transporter